MTRSLLALAAVTVAAAPLAATARADDTQVQLPQPYVGLTPEPPLTSAATVSTETRVPGSIDSLQRVRVGVDPTGKPRSVEAVQELTLNGTGDYIFIVPAPATDVRPGPTTESEPGFRKGAILWQGFSPGKRRLAALVRLESKPAFAALPLRVALDGRVAGRPLARGGRADGPLDLTLHVTGRTATQVQTFGGRALPKEVAAVLDDTRAALRTKRPLPAGIVTLKGAVEKRSVAGLGRLPGERRAPVRARADRRRARRRGEHRAPRPRDDRPLREAGRRRRQLDLELTGRASGLGAPTLELEAVPDLDVRGLAPPRGGTWTRALRQGLVRPDGRQLLSTAIGTFLRLARTNQYETFLLNPDVGAGLTRNRATYTYVTVAAPAVRPAPPADGGGDGLGPGALAALLAAVTLGAGGLAVLWAHS